jgi:predicted XRE-type DNA-binding protein
MIQKETTRYDVRVYREDELWVADVGDLGVTDMLCFADLDVEVRDYVSGMTDVEPQSFDLMWHYRAGDDDITDLIQGLAEVEIDIEHTTARRDALRQEIIGRMSAAGLSQRAIGDVLGLSHQRVHQLARAVGPSTTSRG